MKMKVTATFYYEVPDDLEKRLSFYGTSDPGEMAVIDEANPFEDLLWLAKDRPEFTITPVEENEK